MEQNTATFKGRAGLVGHTKKIGACGAFLIPADNNELKVEQKTLNLGRAALATHTKKKSAPAAPPLPLTPRTDNRTLAVAEHVDF